MRKIFGKDDATKAKKYNQPCTVHQKTRVFFWENNIHAKKFPLFVFKLNFCERDLEHQNKK